jgi:hypothetical protein
VIIPKDPEKQDSIVDIETNTPKITFDTRPIQELYDEARSILLNRNGPYDKAIDDLRSIILTNPPDVAKLAHEYLGYAYEKSKLYEKAMREYAVYLSLYPEENDDRMRVRQRLMSIEIVVPKTTLDISRNKTPHIGNDHSVNATVSEYVYMNNSGANTTQVSSITGVQYNISLSHNQYNLSSRLRLTEIKDLSGLNGNRTSLYTAYAKFEDTFKHYNVIVGRQMPEAGAISRFDGVSALWDISDELKVVIAGGKPYVGMSSSTSRSFEGAEIDWSINRDWTVGLYYNRETADKLLERSAIGTDINYRDDNTNILTRIEYDTVYHSYNSITIQANKFFKNYQIFGLYERRRSPMLYADSALSLGGLNPDRQVYNSVSEMISKSGLNQAEIYNYIESSTPFATSFVVGANKKLNKQWTVATDFQVTNLSTVPGFNIVSQTPYDPVPIQIGQSNSYALGLHLTGDNILKENNTTEFVLNHGIGSINSYSITAADNFRKNKNTTSLIVRYDYYDHDNIVNKTVSTMLRGIYTINDHHAIEAQYSRAWTLSPDYKPTDSLYIGYRYDF